MKQGNIKVIMVKDLSRLGRDYIGVGDYIEQIFPLMGVRFIAVNNSFDSMKLNNGTPGIEVAVSNLVNNMYSRDIAKKIRAALETNWKNGKATCTNVPFGYVWNKKGGRRWEIDPEAAVCVKKVFELALSGCNTTQIAYGMNELNLPTPGLYAEAAEKGGFEHFMMKEIHEQPKAVQDTLNSVIKNGVIDLSSVEITEDEIKNFEQIYIVACGSAWHVGMAAQYVLEDMAEIPVRVELASEFRYRKMPLNQKALVIVVSQSGETADTLAALRLAKEKGITTMAIVNVVGSSIAREADKVFYTLAGPEISVATTKAYSAQLAAMYCLAVQFAKVREKITEEQYSYYISELLTLPEKMQKTLEDKERIQWFAAKYANAHDVFFVGRGIDYAVCLEGSLKLKEISYIHSEAYAAGELKHGTISLIEQGTLVIGVLTQSELYEKTISNMLECKSRGAYLMGLTTYGKYEIEDQVNFTVYVPKVDEHFVGSLAVIPLQLLGYYVSVAKGLDVDKPRNLAKSVTVE